MKIRLREKLRYRFENFMTKGGGSMLIVLIFILLAGFSLTMVLRGVTTMFYPEARGSFFKDFGQHAWTVILEIADPGNLGEETEAPVGMKIVGVLGILVGMILFSMLVAFLNNLVENLVYNFRKGKSKVTETNHSLILGWNERVFDIIRELIIANESEKNACVVILAEEDKEEMDEELSKQLGDTKNTRIVTRSGIPSSLTDLERVNTIDARSAIILSTASENDSPEEQEVSDTRALKTILALITIQGGENNLNIVAEIFSESRRALIKSFDSEQINCISSWEILGKILVQTSRSTGRSSGLAIVYNEILSFDGCEIYFYPASWNNARFYDLYRHFKDGIPIGIHRSNGEIIIHPPQDAVMGQGDEIIVVAEDNSTVRFNPTPIPQPADLPTSSERKQPRQERELMLGWSPIAPIVIREYADYLMEGSVIDIMIGDPSDEIVSKVAQLQKTYTKLNINLISATPISPENLSAINPFTYDNVIILAQKEKPHSSEEVDSDTLVILLLLRRLFNETGLAKKKTQIITQVMNSENQDLVASSSADDFLVSNKMITMMLAQLSEQPKMKLVYDELFKEEGSEIYLKPASYYFQTLPVDISFAGIMAATNKRGEICLGIRENESFTDPEKNFGIILNPDKQQVFHIDSGDTIVVLAEDEF